MKENSTRIITFFGNIIIGAIIFCCIYLFIWLFRFQIIDWIIDILYWIADKFRLLKQNNANVSGLFVRSLLFFVLLGIIAWLTITRLGSGFALNKALFVIGIVILSFAFIPIVSLSPLQQYSTPKIIDWECVISGCYDFPKPANIKANITYPPIISQSNSISISANVQSNIRGTINCENGDNLANIAVLSGPGFDISPSDRRETSIENPTWVWILKPKYLGRHLLNLELVVLMGSCELDRESYTFSIDVVNFLGLNYFQVKMLGALSGFLGTALTLPGLITLWKKNVNNTKRKTER